MPSSNSSQTPVPYHHGARYYPDGSVTFNLWAPAQPRIELDLEGRPERIEMAAMSGGWHCVTLQRRGLGRRYMFVLPDGTRVPDPASHCQPDGVRGTSELVDPDAYVWRDRAWASRPWHTAVLYELHLGAFSPEGTFRGVVPKLDHLVSLGVTAIEIMPIGTFPGRRNWGYDVIFPYACQSTYGSPDDLKHLVDEAHARGLMVLLDVVYNHFGPEGNLLALYAPDFFTKHHHTPWGAAINFDTANSGPVREFFIQNAIRWVSEFHLDGLRLDAVHEILDDGDWHVLDELAQRVRASVPGRPVHLLLQNEENEARRLVRGRDHQPVSYTAQWNDDAHHVLHTAITAERCGYYADYAGNTALLGRALAEGFAFQGEVMHFRGSARGEASRFLPPDAFVAFVQNHDQIGNRARGERWGQLASHEARRAAAAVYLLLPQIPMLFMGEEWNATRPFPFFCDFEGELAEAVRQGRRAEFAHLPEFSDQQQRLAIPDPLSAATFASAVLDWEEPRRHPHAEWLEWYRRVLAMRQREIVPLLAHLTGTGSSYAIRGPGAVTVEWRHRDGNLLRLNANLAMTPAGDFPMTAGRELWLEGRYSEGGLFEPWTVQWQMIDE
jgi:malto-oligosyltrehalose trehalohydrolase